MSVADEFLQHVPKLVELDLSGNGLANYTDGTFARCDNIRE